MDRLSLFSSPLFLGFDHFERLIDSLSKIDDSYPPYNIEQLGELGFRITLALAGFKRENISITMNSNQLTIKGKQTSDPNIVYLHRGIAARQFVKSFVLADCVEIKDAEFNNGLLHINLYKIKNEDDARTIEINAPPEEVSVL
jgi:HSP20 family molecular chaperone IbpA